VKIPSHDGVMLDGWVASPSVPAGTRTPAILTVSPYFDEFQVQQGAVWYDNPSSPGGVLGTGQAGTFWDDPFSLISAREHSTGFPPIRLIKRGYTLVYVSVRGTGSSGGCFELGGHNEQLDAKAIVDWIADQSWSNQRVGMSGLSYMSWMTWSAAVQAPRALKAILTAGDLIDWFQFVHSPQAARSLYFEQFFNPYGANASALGGALSTRTDFLGHATCTEFTKYTTREGLSVGSDRNAAYWEERSVARRLPKVRAAVLDTGGYREVPAHGFQDATIWGSLDPKTPAVQFRGYWGHSFPWPGNPWGTKLDLPSGTTDWETVVTRWFDYWLKGIGPEPRTGVVYHQDQELKWHEAPGWSPAPSKKEVLYLSDAGLTVRPGAASTSFRDVPPSLDQAFGARGAEYAGLKIAGDSEGTKFSLCPDSAALNVSRTYSAPVASKTLIAGNPFVDLSVTSDMAAGMVTAELFDLGPAFECTGPQASDARWIATGSADLSFYADPFRSSPFPVDHPTEVRIDLSDITYMLAPGHRLVLVLSHGEAWERFGTTTFPTITIGASSELILPVAEGGFGGLAPTRNYPPRPFTPPRYTD
jgi:predicted acyl esterase